MLYRYILEAVVFKASRRKLSYHQTPTLESQFGLAKAVGGKRKDLGSIPLRLSFLFKGCGLWTRPCDFVPHN